MSDEIQQTQHEVLHKCAVNTDIPQSSLKLKCILIETYRFYGQSDKP